MKSPLPILLTSAVETDRASHMILIEKHYQTYRKEETHWLQDHFARPTAFGLQLLAALATCEIKASGLGFQLARELAEIPYANDHLAEQMFEHLLQKLIEVAVLRTLVSIDWPEGTNFLHEPKNPVSKKRPEFVVDTPDHVYVVEVKAPGLLEHQRNRQRNRQQVPARSSLTKAETRERALALFEGGVTLPQDNKLKDFLQNAQAKIAHFQTAKSQTGLLFVAWDGFMYEPISSLNHVESGLFTEESFHKDANNARVSFDTVDGVILLNHLSLMHSHVQGVESGHRSDPFLLNERSPSPNVWCVNIGGRSPPETLLRAFDAVPAEAMAMFADYAPTEFISWLSPQAVARERAARQRKTGYAYGVSTIALDTALS